MKGVLEDEAYSYDPVGNRLTDIEARSYTYNNGNELLTQNGTSFTFDANGNMTSKTDSSGATTYTYNSENRLVQINTQPVTGNPQLVIYKYDPFGRRIEKSVTDTAATGTVTVKRFVYDREDILFELDGSGNVVTEYLHGRGIDEPIAMINKIMGSNLHSLHWKSTPLSASCLLHAICLASLRKQLLI
ncbi:MAG: RHS repeat protein [Nitrospirae bacterium]|nr:RHS repeat protein [Nitrospirota bacterium]